MDQKLLHELSIAYAQARLARKQNDADSPPSEAELYNFAYDYRFAMDHILDQLKAYPKF